MRRVLTALGFAILALIAAAVGIGLASVKAFDPYDGGQQPW